MNPYCRLVPRLNGREIEERFDYYLGLVRKGAAGFIVFGGELETVRTRLKELQGEARQPLIVASDLEQGLGQQINGGTLFPPAMAIASAMQSAGRQNVLAIIKRLYTAMALEARYAGINTILAPVLDINTNPENPIIATRAFGEDAETVSFFCCEMIRILQEKGIIACGKHFPGHGDTEADSHISLPVVKKELQSLEALELVPFKRAIQEGVGMIMLGHLSVPSLDPSGAPASLSERMVSYIRKTMGFNGVLITDAMNMGGLGNYSENEASLISLKAGVDLILHPTDPDKVASCLSDKNYRTEPLNIVIEGRENCASPDFKEHKRLSAELTEMAVRIEWKIPVQIRKPFMVILKEEDNKNCFSLIDALRSHYAGLKYCVVLPEEEVPVYMIPRDSDVVVCIFSGVRAWKRKTDPWMQKVIEGLRDKAKVFISFGNPYVLRNIKKSESNAMRIYAFWDSEDAENAVGGRLIDLMKRPF